MTPGDYLSIELTGGAFQGFVDTKERLLFHDFWTDRRAYWDSFRGKVVQVYLETCAEGSDGQALVKSQNVQAYTIAYVKSSLTHEVIDQASFILKSERGDAGGDGLRSKASQLHQTVKNLVEDRQGLIDGGTIASILTSTVAPPFILVPK